MNTTFPPAPPADLGLSLAELDAQLTRESEAQLTRELDAQLTRALELLSANTDEPNFHEELVSQGRYDTVKKVLYSLTHESSKGIRSNKSWKLPLRAAAHMLYSYFSKQHSSANAYQALQYFRMMEKYEVTNSVPGLSIQLLQTAQEEAHKLELDLKSEEADQANLQFLHNIKASKIAADLLKAKQDQKTRDADVAYDTQKDGSEQQLTAADIQDPSAELDEEEEEEATAASEDELREDPPKVLYYEIQNAVFKDTEAACSVASSSEATDNLAELMTQFTAVQSAIPEAKDDLAALVQDQALTIAELKSQLAAMHAAIPETKDEIFDKVEQQGAGLRDLRNEIGAMADTMQRHSIPALSASDPKNKILDAVKDQGHVHDQFRSEVLVMLDDIHSNVLQVIGSASDTKDELVATVKENDQGIAFIEFREAMEAKLNMIMRAQSKDKVLAALKDQSGEIAKGHDKLMGKVQTVESDNRDFRDALEAKLNSITQCYQINGEILALLKNQSVAVAEVPDKFMAKMHALDADMQKLREKAEAKLIKKNSKFRKTVQDELNGIMEAQTKLHSDMTETSLQTCGTILTSLEDQNRARDEAQNEVMDKVEYIESANTEFREAVETELNSVKETQVQTTDKILSALENQNLAITTQNGAIGGHTEAITNLTGAINAQTDAMAGLRDKFIGKVETVESDNKQFREEVTAKVDNMQSSILALQNMMADMQHAIRDVAAGVASLSAAADSCADSDIVVVDTPALSEAGDHVLFT